jgi:hypothetical protein
MNYCFDLTEIIVSVLGIIGASSLVSIKIVKSINNRKTINQNRNTTNGGDIIGGNKTTTN